MGVDCGASGVWGVLIAPETVGQPLYDRLKRCTSQAVLDARCEAGSYDDELLEGFDARVNAAILAETGIVMPEHSHLARVEEQPFRGELDTGDLVFGIGMFEAPWAWPTPDPTFVAAYHSLVHLYSWVWAG